MESFNKKNYVVTQNLVLHFRLFDTVLEKDLPAPVTILQ